MDFLRQQAQSRWMGRFHRLPHLIALRAVQLGDGVGFCVVVEDGMVNGYVLIDG